jgi:hypothetical protein
VRRVGRVRLKYPNRPSQDGLGADLIAARGVRQRDGHLSQAAPQLAFSIGRGLPLVLEHLMGEERQPVVDEPLRQVERLDRRGTSPCSR